MEVLREDFELRGEAKSFVAFVNGRSLKVQNKEFSLGQG